MQSSQSLDNDKPNNHCGNPGTSSSFQFTNFLEPENTGDEDEPEEFIYEDSTHHTPPLSEEGEEEEAFRYTVSPLVETAPRSDSPPAVSLSHSTQVSLAQLTSILSAAGSGNIWSFQRQFDAIIHRTNMTPFTLANEASPRTGFTVLHVASTKGHLDIVKWRKFSSRLISTSLSICAIVIEDCGAMVDLEDKENEVIKLYWSYLTIHLRIRLDGVA